MLRSDPPDDVRVDGTLVLGHGARGGPDAPDLVALAGALPPRGWRVLRVEQPWRVAGRRVAARPPVLDEAWLAVLVELAADGLLAPPLVVGGRSAGARVACRTARLGAGTSAGARIDVSGVVALAFPLQPPPRRTQPARPAPSRRPELEAAGVRVLVVQGERDAFGGPEDLGCGPYDLVAVPAADHSFRAPASAGGTTAALARVTSAVQEWLSGLESGGARGGGAAEGNALPAEGRSRRRDGEGAAPRGAGRAHLAAVGPGASVLGARAPGSGRRATLDADG